VLPGIGPQVEELRVRKSKASTIMSAKIIDGIAVSTAIRAELRSRVAQLTAGGHRPGLAVIVAGSDPASAVYVRNKMRACDEVGIRSFKYEFPADAKPQDVLDKIRELNADPAVHGILVQLPLPPQFSVAPIRGRQQYRRQADGTDAHAA
jgi:methylenetetrahydrofolate dehydrogenase (NADP+)/methenyltetrahydrofolate cyclohydrolase